MKLLFIHSDFIEYEVKKPALKGVEALPPERQKGRMEEALVVFYSVEADDAQTPESIVEKAVANVVDVTNQVKTKNVVLYPYAHLSGNLAKPQAAREIGGLLEKATAAAGFSVLAVPFGYYKAFSMRAKGHPLAELSRTVARLEKGAAGALAPVAVHRKEGEEPAASEALKKEKELRSEWFVLTPDGTLTPGKDFDFKGHDGLRNLYLHETQGTRKAEEAPAHVRLMQELELVDYEPGSDPGNFRWYPKGQLIKRLLETHVSDLVASYGGVRVETPIMYDFAHPALAKYLNRFPARQYTIKSDEKEYFLRFAACFGQYLIMHDATISYRHLPLRVYELTHYSFRREQRGELTGLRRLRTFTMPDMHTLTADMEAAKYEFLEQFKVSQRWMRDLGVPYEAGVRFVRDFYEANRDFAVLLAKLMGKPILIEMWKDRFFYFVMKFEFNVNDASGKASALSTVQIDVENAERFDIAYTGEDGAKHRPLVLHASFSGSIDRNVYALLEQQAIKAKRNEKTGFPFWLAPTQVRFLPVSDQHVPACVQAAEKLACRADVDDRVEGIGRKIRDAETEWVPLIVVYGEKEAASGRLAVRVRGEGQREMGVADLEKEIAARQEGLPKAPLPLPMRLTKRPAFRG
ncbi:MAG: threonine--tRNA ligase [Methanobacteriota archaeon]